MKPWQPLLRESMPGNVVHVHDLVDYVTRESETPDIMQRNL